MKIKREVSKTVDFQEIEVASGHAEITDVPEEGITIIITKEEKYCLATCNYFTDWARGKTYWEALRNLMTSLEDKYKTLKKEKLGKAMAKVLERFEKGGSD